MKEQNVSEKVLKVSECERITNSINSVWYEKMMPFYEKHNISYPNFKILLFVTNEELVTLNNLSLNMDKASANISVAVKRMEENGLLFRKNSKNDHRINYICATKKGEEIVNEGSMFFGNILEKTFPEDDQKIDVLLAALKDYYKQVETNILL